MKIELTEQQEQAVKQGRPVEVMDPASARSFVVLDRELFERVRPLLEGKPEQPPTTAVASAPPSAREGEAQRVRLRDLPTPPEIVAEAQELCAKYAWRGSAQRRGVQDQLMLQYYYGGQAVYVLRTAEGPVVVPIPDKHKDTPDLRYVLLTAEERSIACLEVPPPWRDTVSEILT